MNNQLVIHTIEKGWLKQLAKAYKERAATIVVDDGNVGIDPSKHTLFDMGLKARLSQREIAAVGVSCGLSVIGVAILVAALLDPEPFSKLGLLVGSGVLLTALGGFSAIHILTQVKPPSVKMGPKGFEITW